MRVARDASTPRFGPPRDNTRGGWPTGASRRLAHRGEPQLVRVLLAPFQAGFLTVHAQPEPALIARRHLAPPQHAARAVFEPQQHVHVVIEPAARHESAQVRGELAHRQARDEAGEIVRVRADVAKAAAHSPARGIDAPLGLLLSRVFQFGRKPILHILDLHDADRAQLARRDHLARLPHHRIPGVVVRDPEDETGTPHGLHQVERVGDGGGHWLVTDDVDAAIEKCAGDGVVAVVRRDDAHDLDAVGSLRLCSRHLGEVLVNAVRREAEIGAARPCGRTADARRR